MKKEKFMKNIHVVDICVFARLLFGQEFESVFIESICYSERIKKTTQSK